MAISLASSTTNTNTGTSIALTKPTGLTAGDLLVAFIGIKVTGNSTGNLSLTGWTDSGVSYSYYDNGSNTTFGFSVLYKVADSSDAAASDFTFTRGASATNQGYLARITGYRPNSFWQAGDNEVLIGVTSPASTTDKGLTPTTPSSLIFIMISGTATSYSGYAIETSNPSWTEIYDNGGTALAYSTRPQTTATGDITFAFESGSQNALTNLFCIGPTVPVTITAVPATLTLAGGTTLVKTGIKVLATAASLVLSGGSHLIKRTLNWTNSSKNSSSWSGESKNSASWSTETKSSSPTFINENKTDI